MKRWIGFGIIFWCLAATAMAADPAAQTAPEAGGDKVVFTFDGEEKMKAFETLWRQRQVAAVRMTVLQSYWNEEQTLMTKLNEQLANEYKVDVSKAYSLDPEKRVLVEHTDQPAMPVPQAPAASPSP